MTLNRAIVVVAYLTVLSACQQTAPQAAATSDCSTTRKIMIAEAKQRIADVKAPEPQTADPFRDADKWRVHEIAKAQQRLADLKGKRAAPQADPVVEELRRQCRDKIEAELREKSL